MNVDKVKQVLASIALDRTVMIIKLRIIAWARIRYSNAFSMGAPVLTPITGRMTNALRGFS